MQHGNEVPGESDRSIGGMARRLSFLPVWRSRVWLGSHTSMNVYTPMLCCLYRSSANYGR